MKHEVINQTKSEVVLFINLDEKFLSPIKTETVARLKQNLKVDGFRPGKTPNNIAERHIDSSKLQLEVVETALSRSYAEAIKKQKLEVLDSPKVEIKKFVPYSLLEYTATVALMPKINFDYGKLSVKEEPHEVSDDEVEKTLTSLQNQMAKRTNANRSAKKGDEVVIDFEGTRQGQPVEGAAAQNHIMRLGEGQFIPGFEDNLIGMTKGGEKSFTLTFPKDYYKKDLANQSVDFKVKVTAISQIELPVIDDAFAKRVGGFATVAKLKDDIKIKLADTQKTQAKKAYEDKVIEELIKKIKLDISDILLESQIHQLTHNMEDQLKSSGLSWEQYASLSNKKEDSLRQEIREEAIKRVTLGLVIRDIIIKQKFSVDEIEVADEISKLRQSYTDPKMLEELDHDHFKSDIASHLLSRKAIDWLIEQAKGVKK